MTLHRPTLFWGRDGKKLTWAVRKFSRGVIAPGKKNPLHAPDGRLIGANVFERTIMLLECFLVFVGSGRQHCVVADWKMLGLKKSPSQYKILNAMILYKKKKMDSSYSHKNAICRYFVPNIVKAMHIKYLQKIHQIRQIWKIFLVKTFWRRSRGEWSVQLFSDAIDRTPKDGMYIPSQLK